VQPGPGVQARAPGGDQGSRPCYDQR
jgi:hypothetical protein